MREGDLKADIWFSTLSTVEQREWLDAKIRENAERRLRECGVRGHLVVANEDECPHCSTPYAEIESAERG
jgi:hypothetical protein